MNKTLWALGGYALFVVTVCVSIASTLNKQAENATLHEKVRVAREARSKYQALYAEAATSVEKDTVRVTKYRTRYDSLTDTLRISDTVWVKATLDAADSTIQACHDLVTSCSRFRVAADSTIGALARERDGYQQLYQAVKPSRWSKAKPYVFGAAGLWLGLQVRR